MRPIREGGEYGPAMPRGVYILPNLFTTASIFIGFYAILSASQGQFFRAAVCIVVAHICDGLDGRIARLTNTTSAFGVQYDSLADLLAATVLLYDYFNVPADSSRYVLVPILVYSLALLMVSNVPYYSFKDINVRSRQPFSMLVAAVILVMLIIAEPQVMLFGGMLIYGLSGPIKGLVGWLREDVAVGDAEPSSGSKDRDSGDGAKGESGRT